MREIWSYIRHNQSLFVGILICLGVGAWAWGCESRAKSIRSPGVLVSRSEMDIEVETFLATAQLRYAELDQQDEFKRVFFATAITLMQGGTVNPIAVALVIGNILGLGAVIDNRRKDVKIKTLKGNNQNAGNRKPT